MKSNLSKEEMFEAVKQGVKEAFLTMMESGDGYTGLIRTEEAMKAIKEGVFDAFWAMIRNGTDMPCSDFFYHVKEGVAEGMKNLKIPS